MTSASEKKWRNFNYFSVQKTGGSPTGPDQENKVGDQENGSYWKILEAQVGQFLLGCKCPVRRGIVVQEQDRLGEYAAAFFLQSVFQFHLQSSLIPAFIVWLFGR